jgi:tetratricopeptide (TPR) repeat protein/photosystem II stability/assembly factor-like uncharacterized protein
MDTVLPSPEIPIPDESAINPYIAGAPVVETRMFFGREDIFEWIEKSLGGQYADHILVVHGQRRVGKTSVLKQLGNRLPKRYVPIFFDLQGRTHTTLDRFLWWLAREIARVLKQERGIDVPLPEKDAFTADPDYFENHFLPELLPVLKGSVLLLTFDEFDNLEEEEIKEALARPLVDYLRRVMGTEGLNFIYSIGSSGRKLENMQASYTEFFKTALYRKISFLSKDQVGKLIAEPVKGLLEYEKSAVDLIYQIAFGHPYFTQLICHELFALHQRTGRKKIREEDVKSILDDVVERGTVNLKFVWDEASDLEKWTLAGLAHVEGKSDFQNLSGFLRKQRVRFTDPNLNAALLHLREKDVLAADNHFVIQLLKMWLTKNRPLEQVRDELTEVNPIANRYIEIGMEFKDTRQYERAIESFQEALSVDADNIQAQTSIALVYLDQKVFDKAVVEFEKALSIDEEDVASRSGMCEAHLALGDLSLAKGRIKDAIISYQRVLAINGEHTEARQRMAEVHKQRAEKALADGNDEDALSAFADALKFTPEDPVLANRVAQVQDEKRTKVIKSLSVKADKEMAARNWKQAITFYEDALRLSPEDETLLKNIEYVREKQKTVRLDAIKIRANQAVQTSRWEDAENAFKEYLSLAPDDKSIQKQLEQVDQKAHEAALTRLRTKANGLAKVEKFENAIQTWQEYLELNPPDKEKVKREITDIQEKKSMADQYAKAQENFSKHNYGTAISLLKEIVLKDENYKNVSVLLAEAIEARQAAQQFWRLKWFKQMLAIGGSVIGIVIVGFLAIKFLGPALSGSDENLRVVPTISQNTPVPTKAPELTSTPTATAIPLLWNRISSALFVDRDEITAIVAHPSDPGVMYIGTAHAGVFKTIDEGRTWNPAQKGLPSGQIGSIAVDPHSPDTLFTALLGGGVYKSDDGGENWRLVEEYLNTLAFHHQVVVAPWNSQIVFHSSGYGIQRSDDGGETWYQVVKDLNCLMDMGWFVVHPTEPETLFASVFSPDPNRTDCVPGIYKSTDGGATWNITSLQHVADLGWGPDFMIDNQNGQFMYAAGKDANGNSKLYASQDGGETWKVVLDQQCVGIGVNSENGTQVFCIDWYGKLLTSTTAGSNWRTLSLPGNPSDIGMRVYATNNKVLVGTKGVFLSTDGGNSWKSSSAGLGAGILELKINPSGFGDLYLLEGLCSNKQNRLYESSDGGQTWNLISEQGCDLAFDAGGNTLYRTGNQTIYRSDNNGTSWQVLSFDLQNSMTIRANPAISGEVYAASNDDLWSSSDLGKNWMLSFASENYEQYPSIVSDNSGKILYWNLQFRSDDRGQNWITCGNTDARQANSGNIFALDPRDANHLFAATNNGVLESTDGCASWNQKNNGLENLQVNMVVLDPANPDTLYAGTDGGAYVSFNSGDSWGLVNEGLLGATVVYSIAIDAQSNVYAVTPYGIFRLEGK